MNRVKIKLEIQSISQWTSICLKHVGTLENLTCQYVLCPSLNVCLASLECGVLSGYHTRVRVCTQSTIPALILRALDAAVMLLNVPPLK